MDNQTLEDWGEVYTAQVLQAKTAWGWCVHLVIQRHDGAEINASWSQLQVIKNDLVGENIFMIEIYPAQSHVVNEANKRHLWEIPSLELGDYNLFLRGNVEDR
jgi:hypothetical protein